MKFGKSNRQRYESKVQANEKKFDEMVPKQVFAWVPCLLNTGEWVWLQRVWRHAIVVKGLEYYLSYSYFLTYEEALENTKRMNCSEFSYEDVREAARKRLLLQ